MGRAATAAAGALFSAIGEIGSLEESFEPAAGFVSAGFAPAVELGAEEDASEGGTIGAGFGAAGGTAVEVVFGGAATCVKGVAAPLERTHCIHTE